MPPKFSIQGKDLQLPPSFLCQHCFHCCYFGFGRDTSGGETRNKPCEVCGSPDVFVPKTRDELVHAYESAAINQSVRPSLATLRGLIDLHLRTGGKVVMFRGGVLREVTRRATTTTTTAAAQPPVAMRRLSDGGAMRAAATAAPAAVQPAAATRAPAATPAAAATTRAPAAAAAKKGTPWRRTPDEVLQTVAHYPQGLGPGQMRAGQDTVCTVCFEECLRSQEEVVQLGCNHFFHIDCIRPWIDGCNYSCPMCRHPI
ncbi:hypothetical protein STCU_10896 [Strigomonas culicis]|uniref:RING-type domain-containing protein n=1 Tax=Strigomonas culicis TaxID=28005 RepID=S9TFU8_9TRYP|nr:hypothetical protein STCU_10896 [Strigomonas culicis]|eukprot:EPY16947.1 hypothetical protein STCU_10896 [Strigomonas culicis]